MWGRRGTAGWALETGSAEEAGDRRDDETTRVWIETVVVVVVVEEDEEHRGPDYEQDSGPATGGREVAGDETGVQAEDEVAAQGLGDTKVASRHHAAFPVPEAFPCQQWNLVWEGSSEEKATLLAQQLSTKMKVGNTEQPAPYPPQETKCAVTTALVKSHPAMLGAKMSAKADLFAESHGDNKWLLFRELSEGASKYGFVGVSDLEDICDLFDCEDWFSRPWTPWTDLA
ncbi:hypothetical protein E2C01_007188 [Portunus trituberculatus]|uniref:Uncharacterized protein n=1 Tax=Portunus trituberculatus TaxID=210409 RepID=A0A5B7CXH2_PORTR|nr:hypothetical protein [Portunus trituberculatus]